MASLDHCTFPAEKSVTARGRAVKRQLYLFTVQRRHTPDHTTHSLFFSYLSAKKTQQKRAKTIFLFKHHSTAAGKTPSLSISFSPMLCLAAMQPHALTSRHCLETTTLMTTTHKLCEESRSNFVSDASAGETRTGKKKKKHGRGCQNSFISTRGR